ncbi:UbiD family decarboxylase [Paenibacillus protaetiae]|uniref:UbiD family decarboxylase n=1 Tax=Paenibacillus protaetiae TaxID=2509456 RepID=A0A4P6EYM5_9BACL|nr:UbiD family decarboxylase [Paenibacillus protaetiae]QAY68212.1 UbiD family decarboxylase [Paenibacillus protaetiae]
MSFSNLREFVDALKKENDLIVIDAPVDPYLELAEIHRRIIEEEGPALLFTNVKGSTFPVLTNMFGTNKRVDLAFGPRPEALVKQLMGAMDRVMPPSAKAIWGERSLIWEMLKVGVKEVPPASSPILQASKRERPLAGLPAITSWQEDGGPFVTLPLVYTESPLNRKLHNLGMYRMQIFDDQTTGMHWQIHKGGGFHYHEAEKRNEALPVSVFLGGPPALIASAIAPLPENLPELMMASLIMGGKVPLVKDPIGSHRIPSEAEFVISGKVEPHIRRPEGPFGDHFGYYSLIHDFPVFNVSHVWHRKDAIYPATIVGKPRQEDYYLGEFLQRLLSPAYPMAMPGVKDLWAYAESGVHALAAAVVREAYSREALSTAFRILGEGQLRLTKFLMLTNEAIDLSRFDVLMETVLERFNPHTDLFVFDETSHDTLDYTSGKLNHGSKAVMMGIGAPVRSLPSEYTEGVIDGITDAKPYCKGCLVVSGAEYSADPGLGERLLQQLAGKGTEWPLVILADDTSIVQSQTAMLWTVFTRFNPADDIYANVDIRRHHFGYKLPIVIDARMKPGYPDELFPREDIVKLVDSRWSEYFKR